MWLRCCTVQQRKENYLKAVAITALYFRALYGVETVLGRSLSGVRISLQLCVPRSPKIRPRKSELIEERETCSLPKLEELILAQAQNITSDCGTNTHATEIIPK